MKHAHDVGLYLLKQLKQLADRHQIIGDVRGYGLFAGIDLVKDRVTREQISLEEAKQIQQRLRDHCVIMSLDGPYSNVLKFKSPMTFSMEDVDFLCEKLNIVLNEWYSLSLLANKKSVEEVSSFGLPVNTSTSPEDNVVQQPIMVPSG